MEWPDLSGFGLHLKTFYFKNVFGFNDEVIGTVNLLIDTLPVIRSDKAKIAGLISLIGQPNHNIYEEVDVNKPETLLLSSPNNPPNLYQMPTKSDVIIEPALFVAQLGLPIGRYRKVFTTQAEIDYLFYKHATPILHRMKIMLQAQYPYLKNQSDIKIISGPFGRYLDGSENNISDIDPIEVMQTKGDLKDTMSAEYLSDRLIEIYQKKPLCPADISNIVEFSCQAQPTYENVDIGEQSLIEPIMPTENHKVKLEQLFYFSEFVRGRWVSSIQERFLAAALKDDYSIAQISQQKICREHPDRFQSLSMILPQSQDWLLDLCESDKNNPFNDTTQQTTDGSYKTPLFVCYQIARLLSVDGMFEPIDVKPNQKPNLLDMTAGFGNLWSFLSNCSITAFESDSNIYKYLPTISRMFNYLQDSHEFLPLIDDVINESVLTTSLSSAAHGDDLGYHYILATPNFADMPSFIAFPFMDADGIYHFEAKSSRLDHHVVALGLQHLKKHGRMVFLLSVDNAGEISHVESFFYQYLHTYFEVDLIVEMSSSIFYGSGYDKNVRLHVISGKRDMPKDENEIIERTHKAIKPIMPIAKNNSQLNNLVQHYISNKYKKARFDKLISNSLEGFVKRPLPPTIPAYRLLFTDRYAYFKQSPIVDETIFVQVDTDNLASSAIAAGKPVLKPTLMQEADIKPASPASLDDDQQDANSNGSDEADVIDDTANSDTETADVQIDAVTSIDINEATSNDLNGNGVTNEADSDDIDAANISTDGSHGEDIDSNNDDEDGNYPAKETTDIDAESYGSEQVTIDDDDELDFNGGDIDFSSDDDDSEFDDDENQGDSWPNEGVDENDAHGANDNPTESSEGNTDDSEANEDTSQSEGVADSTMEPSDVEVTENGVVFNDDNDDSKDAPSDTANTDSSNNTVSDANNDESKDDRIESQADIESEPPAMVHPDADPLLPMDAITALKQSKLASVTTRTPQGLTMVKQPSLTGKSTGYTTRLISSTQLALYQEVPKITNDLFTLTSSIDGWLYKTFNLNFNAAQKIFELLPDFAKHASAYYCSAEPKEHVIFDVSRRSQYYIAALITLYKLKTHVDASSTRPVVLCYGDSANLIELINCFEVLAISVHASYDKKSSPIAQLLELICVLYKLSAGKSGIDVSHLIQVEHVSDVFDESYQAKANPFLVIVGKEFFDITAYINDNKDDNFDHVFITSHDIFDVDLLPNLPAVDGANNVYSLLPYYLTDELTTISGDLLKDKRLFFLLYEKCLHRASRVGFIQYNYEPLTYADLPVRVLDNPPQEGLQTLIDTLHHLGSQMNVVNAMTNKMITAATSQQDAASKAWFHKDCSLIIDDCFTMCKSALRIGAIQDVISDNYRNGKHSTMPTTLNYNNLVAEYLLYTYHSHYFIEYLKDTHSELDACDWLLSVTPRKDFSSQIGSNNDVVASSNNKTLTIHDQINLDTYKKDFDQESILQVQSNTPTHTLAGYHCPNIKEMIEFVSKRCSMVAVEETESNKHQLVGVDVYVDVNIDGARHILCDISALLGESNKTVFESRTDIIRKFVSIIPKNDISALPFEYTVYQMSRVGVNCIYVSSNQTKFTIQDVVNGRDSIPRLIIEPEDNTLFNFSDGVYSAINDAVIVNIELSYCPNIGIAPLRYNRLDAVIDHFRQRSLIITEFLPSNALKELIFKLSVPNAKSHQSAMVVTDYIDIDVVEVKGYGELNDILTVSSLMLAGFNVKCDFDIRNHAHYLALMDMLKMPQVVKLGLFGDSAMDRHSHSNIIDDYYTKIKQLTQLDSNKQSQLTANLHRYMELYHALYPNGWSWYQSLFYVHHDLKAAPLYDDKTPGENLYPRQFEYEHITSFTPTVAMVVATAKEFVLSQYKTIESYVDSMSNEAKAAYYTEEKNITFEMFSGLSTAHQYAHIYSADFKKQNTHAFKRIVLNEFQVNLDKTPDLSQSVKDINSPEITALYQKLVFVNNHITKGATFISNSFETNIIDDAEVHVLIDFVVSAKVSHNNIDADAFFYGYNHNASPLRRNDKQLYMIWLGIVLPKIVYNDSPLEQFALILPKHIRCPVITNQHDRIVFLDYLTLHQRWQALSGNYQLTIKPKTNELAPNPQREFDNQGNKLSEASATAIAAKAQLECESFCKAFSGSDDSTTTSSFQFITETALTKSVQGLEWSATTGLYDVIRFSNNTNHSFIHIIKKISNNN